MGRKRGILAAATAVLLAGAAPVSADSVLLAQAKACQKAMSKQGRG